MQNLQLFYSIDSDKISQQKYSLNYTDRIFRSYWNFIYGEVVTQYTKQREYFAVIEISLTAK